MIQIKVSDNLDSDALRKLVKAFYRTEDVIVIDDNNISNTIKRKLINDTVSQFISFNFYDKVLTVEFCDGDKNPLKREEIIDINVDDKADFDRKIYNIFSKHTGIELSWGTMNGVHPAKLLLNELLAGKSKEQMDQIIHEYAQRYLISKEKIKLVSDTANNEYEVLRRYDCNNRYSLYVGIPFCPTTCIYCSFASFSMDRFGDRVEDYLKALKYELKQIAKHVNSDNKTDPSPLSVYVGGGTPTSLTANQMDDLLKTIAGEFDLSRTVEFTVEAGRPDSIDRDKLKVMKDNKVTRISINPQTMKERTLEIIGRRHTIKDIVDVYNMAKDLRFDNINMDLIMGLPAENDKDAKATLDKIIELNPANVTVHTLAIKRGAKLGINLKDYEKDIEQDVAAMVDLSSKMLGDAGYQPYYLYRQKNMADGLENTGYTKPGYECLYNILTMEEVQTIVACGAGTVTKRVYPDGRIERCDNVKDIKLYIEKIDEMIDRKRTLLS